MNKDNVEADLTTRDISTRDRAIADMTGADMTGADMTGADMNGAGTTLTDGEGGRQRSPGGRARRLWGGRLRAALASPSLRRLLGRKLVPSVLVGAAVFSYAPAVAQAGTLSETMTLSSNLFPSGAPVPGGLSGTVAVPEGSLVKLTAPQYLYQPSVPPGSIGTVYEFMFWDVNSTLANTGTAKFTAPSSGAAFKASAWYLPVCVVSSSCSNGGTSAVSTWAFSLTADQVLPETPISSVNPPSAWTSPSTSVSTATPVSIAASEYLGPHSKFLGTVFSSWFVFGGGGATVSGLDLSVPAGESPYGIAFYNQYSFHLPPPCIGYPHCI